ncbi:MAG: D-glycero-alpha-D-manno-heptose-1,7-bisphosphate 7-phosphatase [Planctomycetota bacterium]
MTRGARRPAVFLDRDGTLTVEADWVTKSADLELFPAAAEAVALLSRAGFAVVLATNQSAVARGLLTEPELAQIHACLQAEIARGGASLDGIYACPHHPSEGSGPFRRECECRKPKPGMLLAAARDLGLDLERSYVVGDAERDLAAGAAVGARGILVATGKGEAELERMTRAGRAPERFVPDVLAAARAIAADVRQGR